MKKNLIKGYRNAVGYSQSKMAKSIGISTNSYADKERGKRSFTVEEAKLYCEVLKSQGVKYTADEIFFET
ncbi:helix-turn-helix transcriptional regulator [Mammaliicoccus sciuri]|uniref:helix-turn-helix transcriptional regulator n=1 Tax=Mammaliicoccus sciuri TaxID=1296 RepID=UPI00194E80D8|nr:helix-turn-helix domain-containing protein [Mammaliicoccus sciuri]MCJ1776334.1 helix-turn-helix domain-containing protein [Mammaliicoccus sciuri]